MRARIHRGAKEIGGNCVELEHVGQRIVLDVGRPLDSGFDDEAALPLVAGFDASDPSLLGVVISHGHPDHYGLAAELDPTVPLYLGEATQRILAQAEFFTPGGVELHPSGFLRDRQPFDLGPFRITPFLMDHSAFDAYSLLVEAGGRRLFYSGDLRAHGRKAALFERLVAEPPEGVDVVILEGTHIRGEMAGGGVTTEDEVEEKCLKLFRQTEGMVLACYSAQNIDRLVTLHRAAKRSGRTLVLDLYGATIAKATGKLETIPQGTWESVRVFVPLSQRIKVKNSEQFERTGWIRQNRLYPEQLAELAPGLVMTFRGSMAAELERARCLGRASAIWSLWTGYLREPSGLRMVRWMEQLGIPLYHLHSSGHAAVEDLQRLAAAFAPSRVVPMHTSAPERFAGLFERVEMQQDGEWWPV